MRSPRSRAPRRYRNLAFLRRLLATNLAASFALRGAFWLQVSFMALNNLIFFTFWWILFDRFDEIRGWAIGDVAVLFGVSAVGYGLGAVLCGGLPDLARQIDNGELDPWLTQPKNVLVQALASRTRPDGWGDIASGIALIAMSGHLSWSNVLMAPLAALIGATTYVATAVILHSTAFWWGKTETLARQVCDSLVTFSVYPPALFGGPLRLLLFTVLPAGFISYLPAELVRAFSWPTLLAAIAGVAIYGGLALVMFDRGLRRYASGNRFGVRG